MELTDYTATALSSLKDRFQEARYDPTMLVKASLETYEQVSNGQAVLLNPTSPLALSTEMACALAASCVQESIANLRQTYPALATTEEELYLHMSDEDYLNRFAVPGRVTFTLAMQVQDIVRNGVFDAVENNYKLILPRDTTIVIDGITFMTLYPIVIRRYPTGGINIAYDPEIVNPLLPLSSTILNYTVRNSTEGDQWLFIDIEALQVSVTSTEWPITKSYLFRKTVVLADNFTYGRAFYRGNSTNGVWAELKTTHTDQVFDVNDPTIVFKVQSGSVQVEIPAVYLTSGQLTGDLRVDLYSTRGALNLNLSNYQQDAYVITLAALDEARDLSAYTQAMADVSYYVYSSDQLSGGTDALTFEALRDRVIYNSIGPQNAPITNQQKEADVENNGFELVKNVDTVTNRVFLATRKLPKPTNERLITAANIGIVTFAGHLGELVNYSNVINNGDRLTIKSKALWRSVNGQLTLLSQAEIDQLNALGLTTLVNQVNENQYFYTPFHYVLDESGEEFEVRSYALDQPVAKNLNFIRQNQTVNLFVNTGAYELTKQDWGFELRVLTNSGNYYKNLSHSEVGIQLAFNPEGETTYAYINGTLESVNENQERVYVFRLESRFELDSDDLICITNSEVQGVTNYQAWIRLDTTFNLLHHTTSIPTAYQADATDQLLGKFLLPAGSVGNAHERLTLKLGSSLSRLWRRCRSYLTDVVYERHPVDVPLLYDTIVYDTDPDTGSIFTITPSGEIEYLVLHNVGDPVLDEENNPVYKFRAGDIILNEQGQPVTNPLYVTGREMDILVVDGRYLFANDEASVAYREEIDTTLTDWIVDDLADLEDDVLEQTKVYFYPKTTLGDIQVRTENGGEDYLPAEQSFALSLYVDYAVYNDSDIRDSLKRNAVSLLDSYVSEETINITEIQEALKAAFGQSVRALKLAGLGGVRDYQYVIIKSKQNKLCLKKQLSIQADNTLIVEDAVNVEFKLVGTTTV